MRQIIKDGQIVTDHWVHMDEEQEIPREQACTVSLARWKQEGKLWIANQQGPIGVRLTTSDSADEIVADLAHFDLIVLYTPAFTDGRIFSLARLLRSRYHFRGELRASGDILPDQIFYLSRCGVNAFEIRTDQNLETAQKALHTFSLNYQGAEDGLPLYYRRHVPS